MGSVFVVEILHTVNPRISPGGLFEGGAYTSGGGAL